MADDTLDLTSAAGILGISVETLRKRLQRGTAHGFKAPDGTWRIVLDKPGMDIVQDKSALEKPATRRRAKLRAPAAPEMDSKPDNGPDNTVSRGGQDVALIEALRDEIRFLRAEIATRDHQIDRFQVLLQQSQQHQPPQAIADHTGPDWAMWSPWWWWRIMGGKTP
jgi:hypothetical protein